MKKISKFVSFDEAIRSQTAIRNNIDNTPDEQVLKRMVHVAENVFDKVRMYYGQAIIVSSFYRCPKLNKSVGGSATSQHMSGEAIDMIGTGRVSNRMIFNYIKENLLFDQLIWEYGTKDQPAWVHVSLKMSGVNRKQILYIGVK